ncbi:hypothetical protein TSUD_89340 [Trifolium subterraneum]|uniref:Helitron helicase-like domain-containing protein n=1 Tax=Trifolium subterraneum TaxID=3900 RepID=A0A2Z6LM93_TRISU|nr:hypothetical protein TSUD_89340 [Trifolium subterraneum]
MTGSANSIMHSPLLATNKHSENSNSKNTNFSASQNRPTLSQARKTTPLADITSSVVNRQSTNYRSSSNGLSKGGQTQNRAMPQKRHPFSSIQVNLANKFDSANANSVQIPHIQNGNNSQEAQPNQTSKRKPTTSELPEDQFDHIDSSESSEEDPFAYESESDTDDVPGLMAAANATQPQAFRMARDKLKDQTVKDLKLRLIHDMKTDGRLYNHPTVSEVAALIVGDVDAGETRDIIIQEKGGQLTRINEFHPAYLGYQYPLIFPYGEDGFRRGTIQMRRLEAQTLLCSRRLFQQFLVDGFTMMEAERLSFVRNNRSTLRVGKYQKLNADNEANQKSGKRVVLPSTFVGSKRYIDQLYFDGMAISASVGFPDLFITFTCNPNWPEIKRLLAKQNLKPHDRPDIITRVFKIKFNELLKDLTKKHVLGKVIAPPMAHRYTFEALERTLRDVMSSYKNSNSIFGGKVIVFGGDFRQILPVVPRGSRSDIVHASINASKIWDHCKVLTLTQNMRLQQNGTTDEIKEFSKWLLKVGEGKLAVPNDGYAEVDIPKELLILDYDEPIAAIVQSTYPNLIGNFNSQPYLKSRAILASTIEVVDQINTYVLGLVPGIQPKHLKIHTHFLSRKFHVCEFSLGVLKPCTPTQMYPADPNENVKIVRGWKQFCNDNNITMGDRLRFEFKENGDNVCYVTKLLT